MSKQMEIDTRVFNTAPTFTKAADYKNVYTNVVRSGVTPFDIRLVCGQVLDPDPETHGQRSEDLVGLIMSPEEAKSLLQILQGAINGYEQLYGKIRDITPLLEKFKADAIAEKSKTN
jgi:hypothetical protein